MIYNINGKLTAKKDNFVIIETSGIGFKVFVSEKTAKNLPVIGEKAELFTNLHLREDGLDLYGFKTPEELDFFELLVSISGVGPKSAISILNIAEIKNLKAAIKEGRPDLLTRASGIGRKTAERIILELRNKVQAEKSELSVKKMETDSDLAETLAGLGYRRDQAREALNKVDEKITNLEERLKTALKILNKK